MILMVNALGCRCKARGPLFRFILVKSSVLKNLAGTKLLDVLAKFSVDRFDEGIDQQTLGYRTAVDAVGQKQVVRLI